MARQTDATAVRAVVGPVVEDAGLHLEDVVTTAAGSRSVVRVTLDLPEDAVGSLDSDTLADASRAISAALDAAGTVPGAYTLEISTPGTSRPLTELRHFKRARTRLVTLRLTDGSTVEGRLVEVEGTDLVLDDGRRLPVADVARGRVEVELARAEEADGDDDAADLADLLDAADDPADEHADPDDDTTAPGRKKG